MKQYRIISLLLAVLLCVAAVFALSACKKEQPSDQTTETTPAEETTAKDPGVFIDVSKYTLIRADGVSSSAVTAIKNFRNALTAATADFAGFNNDSTESNADALEFLVGETNRPASAAAKEALGDAHGYVMMASGNNIVVYATTDALLSMALDQFLQDYLPSAENGGFYLPTDFKVVKSDIRGVSLLNLKGQVDFKIIFDEDLDQIEGNTPEGSAMTDRMDYAVERAMEFKKGLVTKLGVQVRHSTDYDHPNSATYEILLGDTNRPETRAFLETLPANGYGYAIIGNKVVITGWSHLTSGMAMQHFLDTMQTLSYVDENGKTNYLFSDGYTSVREYDKWNEIPVYDGGTMSGVMEGVEATYEIYVRETSVEQYRAYRAKLEQEGYTLYQENAIAANLYATYTSDKNMIHVYYVDYEQSVRIVTAPIGETELPTLEDPYTKITETSFTIMDLNDEAGNFGNSFIITLEDGSFLVYDGGNLAGNTDAKELYDLLVKLNKREGKPVIAAWVLTHQHNDHKRNFNQMTKQYGSQIILEKVIYNVPSISEFYNSGNTDFFYQNGHIDDICKRMGAKKYQLHTGQKMTIRNLVLEVIFTQEDIYPVSPYPFNNSSMVTRFEIGGQRVTILGDAQTTAAKIMAQMYGETLKSDIVQVAHHGGNGCTTELYELLAPRILIWPTDQANFEKQTAGTSSAANYVVDYKLANQESVKLIIVADGGHKTIVLPYLTDSPDDIIITEVEWKKAA